MIHQHAWPLQQIQIYPNTLKIHMVCVTYIQQIYFIQHSFSYFIYLSYFVYKKKKKKKSKTWPLATYLKKIMGLSFIFNWKNFNTLWVKKNYLYINEVELFISHSLVTKTGMSDNQERGGCTSS